MADNERLCAMEPRLYAHEGLELYVLDRWMICDFTSFSTVFETYQDDGRMIMKGCVQRNPVYS